MQTIAANVQIGADRRRSVQLPAHVAAGEYEVVLVLNQRLLQLPISAMQKIQSLLKQSILPGHSLADELIQERRKAAQHE